MEFEYASNNLLSWGIHWLNCKQPKQTDEPFAIQLSPENFETVYSKLSRLQLNKLFQKPIMFYSSNNPKIKQYIYLIYKTPIYRTYRSGDSSFLLQMG